MLISGKIRESWISNSKWICRRCSSRLHKLL